MTTELGTHTVEIKPDEQSITIGNETVVIVLNSDETYLLLVLLQELFK